MLTCLLKALNLQKCSKKELKLFYTEFLFGIALRSLGKLYFKSARSALPYYDRYTSILNKKSDWIAEMFRCFSQIGNKVVATKFIARLSVIISLHGISANNSRLSSTSSPIALRFQIDVI